MGKEKNYSMKIYRVKDEYKYSWVGPETPIEPDEDVLVSEADIRQLAAGWLQNESLQEKINELMEEVELYESEDLEESDNKDAEYVKDAMMRLTDQW